MTRLEQKLLKEAILHGKCMKVRYGWSFSAEDKEQYISSWLKAIEENPDMYKFYGEPAIDESIKEMKEYLALSPEERQELDQKEAEALADHDCEVEDDFPVGDWREDMYYCPSSTAGDYGPGNPWDAPGMSVRDFI